MGPEWARLRCRERLLRICDAGLDHEILRLELLEQLRGTIGFAMWGWPLADPDTLLTTTSIADPAAWAIVPRVVDYEQRTTDVIQDRQLARSRDPVGILSVATGGDLPRSRRWREIYDSYGVGDELRAACVDRYGCWAHLRLLRASDDPPFDAADAALLRDIVPAISSALRRRTVSPVENIQAGPAEAGIVVLDSQLAVRSWTPSAEAWFGWSVGRQPPTKTNMHCAVISTAARCLAGDAPLAAARARLRLADGRWVVAEAARLHGADSGVAVSIRAATTNDVLGLLVRAYSLTPRERELVALLADGLDTRQLSHRLCISRYTVQQHLKSVFGKVGVRSRRELLTGLLAAHS